MQLQKIITHLRKIADDREWQQFHTPKNLVMALSGEAGELSEIFQWLTDNEAASIMDDAEKAEAVRDEISDILTYTIRLADYLKIDLEQAFWDKTKKTELKYPVALSKGNAKKYTELE